MLLKTVLFVDDYSVAISDDVVFIIAVESARVNHLLGVVGGHLLFNIEFLLVLLRGSSLGFVFWCLNHL